MTHGEITRLLRRAANGRSEAVDQLYRLTYLQLQRIARGQRRRHGRPALELNTTALVHETFLKFERAGDAEFEDREHFFAVAAQAMRQLLVDEARRALRQKRGGGAAHLALDESLERSVDGDGLATEGDLAAQSNHVLDLDRALLELGGTSERLLRVTECKVFAGMEEVEIAQALQVSERTVRRDWAKARAWLALQLGAQSQLPA